MLICVLVGELTADALCVSLLGSQHVSGGRVSEGRRRISRRNGPSAPKNNIWSCRRCEGRGLSASRDDRDGVAAFHDRSDRSL